jgi:hypothetical protein
LNHLQILVQVFGIETSVFKRFQLANWLPLDHLHVLLGSEFNYLHVQAALSLQLLQDEPAG